MKYIPGFLIIIFCMISCIKEKTTDYQAFVKNKSAQNIQILTFGRGNSVPKDTIRLLPNAEFRIAEGFFRGISERVVFISDYFATSDSVHIIFNGVHRVTHYFNTPAAKFPKHYLYASNRNLFQLDSYNYSHIDDSKYQRTATYVYEFTEDDYRFAQ